MNAQNAKDFLPLVQALADGKTIQMIYGDGTWHDRPHLDLSGCPKDYRIKPEPRRWWIRIKPEPRRWWIRFGKNGLSAHAMRPSTYRADEIVEVVEVLR